MQGDEQTKTKEFVTVCLYCCLPLLLGFYIKTFQRLDIDGEVSCPPCLLTSGKNDWKRRTERKIPPSYQSRVAPLHNGRWLTHVGRAILIHIHLALGAGLQLKSGSSHAGCRCKCRRLHNRLHLNQVKEERAAELCLTREGRVISRTPPLTCHPMT